MEVSSHMVIHMGRFTSSVSGGCIQGSGTRREYVGTQWCHSRRKHLHESSHDSNVLHDKVETCESFICQYWHKLVACTMFNDHGSVLQNAAIKATTWVLNCSRSEPKTRFRGFSMWPIYSQI